MRVRVFEGRIYRSVANARYALRKFVVEEDDAAILFDKAQARGDVESVTGLNIRTYMGSLYCDTHYSVPPRAMRQSKEAYSSRNFRMWAHDPEFSIESHSYELGELQVRSSKHRQ